MILSYVVFLILCRLTSFRCFRCRFHFRQFCFDFLLFMDVVFTHTHTHTYALINDVVFMSYVFFRRGVVFCVVVMSHFHAVFQLVQFIIDIFLFHINVVFKLLSLPHLFFFLIYAIFMLFLQFQNSYLNLVVLQLRQIFM